MKVAIVGEGQTEFYCLPTIVGRLGHTVVGTMHIRGGCDACYDWERLVHERVVPAVEVMAYRQPDKVLIALDREARTGCPPELARLALDVVAQRCPLIATSCGVAMVVSNRKFESVLFADYAAVDNLPILNGPASSSFGPTTEENNVISWIRRALRRGCAYDKIRDGKILAQNMDLGSPVVLQRSRSLEKLVSELSPAP